MAELIASLDQSTAVFGDMHLRFKETENPTSCSGCAFANYRTGCFVKLSDRHAKSLCGSSRNDGRNGIWVLD